ncbi:MAG: ATP-binding cassette domain-containing protein [Treponema sp.]|jgi:ribose transport system ATP-binding protein|nr:ATP-binding cassette domain-containing protein [Treponema sp.]
MESVPGPYFELKGIDKYFGITGALHQVNLRIRLGEVIGLVGPNGAGKSTLIKIIAGVLPPSGGEIRIGQTKIDSYTARDAIEAGVSCAYQDLSLCTNLRVYENFALLNMSHTLFGAPKWQDREIQKTTELLEQYFPGSTIDVMKPVSSLTLAERQIVEICKALMAENLKILVLDEPTSALSSDKAGQLHSLVRELSRAGKAVIYISHKLEEIKTVCDRIVLMRNGEVTAERRASETCTAELVALLGGDTGKSIEAAGEGGPQNTPSVFPGPEIELIAIKGFSGKGLRDIHIRAARGEIIGISGLAGSGQNELLDLIFNKNRRRSRTGENEITVSGAASYITGDRARAGIFPQWDILDNMLVSSLKQVVSGLFLNKRKSETLGQFWYDKLKFKAEGMYSPIMSLSGGNQQKALIARGIASGADILVLNDPTAGVDIETKREIYNLLKEAKAEGRLVVFYSTEDAEMEICDRVYIMRDGEITHELKAGEITVPNIVRASFAETRKKETVQKTSRVQNFLSSRALLPLFTMLLMIGINAAFNPNVLSYNSVRMLAGAAVPLVFAGLGQMFITGVGDIDMGNGYSIGLVNVLTAVVLTGNPLIGILSLLIFIGAYVLMGTLIEVRKIPAIVVTLGAQFIWLGASLLLCPVPGGSCPEWLRLFYRYKLIFIPMPVIICAGAALFCYLILFKSKYGIILRGIGNNPQAVTRSGWSYLTAKMTAYALSGAMVVLSGLFFTVVCLGADANASSSFCMLSIATVVLGGCEFSGGIVEPVGVVAGAFAMSLITTVLTFMRIGSNYQTAVLGIILILVLVIKLVTNRTNRGRSWGARSWRVRS